jgi:hypothetical protein
MKREAAARQLGWGIVAIAWLALGTGCRRSQALQLDAAAEAGESPTASASGVEVELPKTPPAPAPPKTAIVSPLPPEEAGGCPANEDETTGVVVSPLRAVVGAPLRILTATLANPEPLALRIETSKGQPVDADVTSESGVPAMVVARLVPKQVGDLRVVVGRHGKGLRCMAFHVFPHPAPTTPRKAREEGVWPVVRNWNRAEEALYSAWIRAMFHAPRGEELAFARLDEVTSNRDRNVLVDHYGWGEDSSSKGLKLKPDCADTPYFLRAYFAWKRALPFAYRHCSSGEDGHPPRCEKLHTILEPPDVPTNMPDNWNELMQVQRFFQRSLQEVHSGNGRVPFDDNESDFYGLKLTREALRPGAVYADPYGHMLSLVEFVDADGTLPGVLYAVDGQPDGSITRKRFWEGNFLWNPDPRLGGSGFKAFRPLSVKYEDGGQIIESLSDAQIAKHPDYGDVSHAQPKLDPNKFYDTIDRVITPSVRDPFVAQEEMVRALSEAAKVRVTSVNNAQPYFAAHPDAVIPMPELGEIFETSGPWEDFSTPSRDLRLLIAIDVVNHFDEKVARQPDAFGTTAGKAMDELREKLTARRKVLLASDELAFSYKRSDGSPQKLTLAELVTRTTGFEASYNPNDCPEYRWGAAPASDEISTCNRHAPDDQRERMESYRVWFRERKRPPRVQAQSGAAQQ